MPCPGTQAKPRFPRICAAAANSSRPDWPAVWLQCSTQGPCGSSNCQVRTLKECLERNAVSSRFCYNIRLFRLQVNALLWQSFCCNCLLLLGLCRIQVDWNRSSVPGQRQHSQIPRSLQDVQYPVIMAPSSSWVVSSMEQTSPLFWAVFLFGFLALLSGMFFLVLFAVYHLATKTLERPKKRR